MLNFVGECPVSQSVLKEVMLDLGLDQYEQPYEIEARKIEKGLKVAFHEHQITVSYSTISEYLRGLALVGEAIKTECFEEMNQEPLFDQLGVMLDCSRNAVVNVETVKRFIRQIAIMGYHTLQLYTEDTYEIESQPYFGYMRGRYNQNELKELDAYARCYGIELVPCIQALAHLGGTLRWRTFAEVSDTETILLVGEEKTYELIEEMVRTSAECFTSRKINIGMDEAHQLGLGNYLRKHGYEDRLQIMLRHLKRVQAICEKYGFEPMMWSDMFFRLMSQTGDYDVSCALGEHPILKELPQSMRIIYWDYYNANKSHYDAFIKVHKQLPNPLVFAGGAWRWRGVVPDNTFSLHMSHEALLSCKEHGVREVFVTAWGDNGGECATFSILPSLVQYSEFCYEGKEDLEVLKKRFKTFTRGEWDDFILLDQGNHPADNPAPGRCSVNPTKYLFFQDPLMGLFDKHVKIGETGAFYKELADQVSEAMTRNQPWHYLFEPIRLTYEILADKAELGARLKVAYDEKNLEELQRLEGMIEMLIGKIKAFHHAHRMQWVTENKRSGLEVQDIRIGGLIMRLEVAKETLEAYRNGRLSCIEELEYERLYFDCREEEGPLSTIGAWWHEIVTPNRIGRT